jgi:hypothetical protein
MMSDSLLRGVAELDAARLDAILRARGVLTAGRVAEVAVVDEQQTPWSTVARLNVTYTPDAPPMAPARLFLKIGGGGDREVRFYDAIAVAAGALPVPPCYDTCFSPEEDRAHLLLADLSETHGLVAPWPMPPRRHEGEAIVESLARLHAFWWESPRLREFSMPYRDENDYAGLDSHVQWAIHKVGVFAEVLGDRFMPEQRALYDRVLDGLPSLWAPYWRDRIATLRGLTLIHGDAHPGNLLYPLDPERGALYMVDWQAYRVRTGVVDVAYMFIFHWYPERRYAMPFLEHYYRSLLANGVTGYDWDTFWLDLQVAVVDYLMDAPRLAEAKVPAHVWWPIYQRGLTAYTEFGCEAVFSL